VRTVLTSLFAIALGLAQKVYTDRDPGVTAPRVTGKSAAEYTDEALLARLEGNVGLRFRVDEDGTLHDVRVMQSIGLGLDEKAVEAVRQWKFEPGTFAGAPVPVLARAEVRFKLLTARFDWHLTSADFEMPRGASRPVLIQAEFPDAIERGGYATAVVSFDVNEKGVPINVLVSTASDETRAAELALRVQNWRFRPAAWNGAPVTVHATFRFAAGQPSSNVSGLE